MLENKKIKIKVVEGINGVDFEKNFNNAMAELNGSTVSIVHKDGFCAIIQYEYFDLVPETKEDVAEVCGTRAHCSDCPHFVKPSDGRRKYFRCPVWKGNVKAETCACEYYYGDNVND